MQWECGPCIRVCVFVHAAGRQAAWQARLWSIQCLLVPQLALCLTTRHPRLDPACLQAALSPRPAGPDTPPTGGDGFTFEHLADKEELWWDFVADTGDGGDPTYA